jgi:ABC-type multidrug transport system ATPase subunit
MQKRFALAAALLGNPKVILLDEILNGLDPGGVALIRRLIRERAKAGCAALLSSHLLPEVQNLCDVIWMLDQGQVLRIIRKEEWEGSKTQFIRISLAGDLSGAVELLGQFGRVEQTPRELVILEPKAGSAEVNEALVKSGFRVQRIGEESRSLEDIYLEALEREN